MANSNEKRVLLLIETSRGFGRNLFQGIQRFVMENRNWTVFFQDRGLLEGTADWIKKWNGDGILSRTSNLLLYRQLREKNIPMLELLGDGNKIPGNILCDENDVGSVAAKHLLSCGLRNFAYFTSENTYWSRMASMEFENVLNRHGFECLRYPHQRKSNCGYAPLAVLEESRDMICEWLISLPKPIGLFAATDLHAMYVLSAARSANLMVPEEIAILGNDNDQLLCQVVIPQLSSVDQNSQNIGYLAAKTLDWMMKGEPAPTKCTYVSGAEVVVRQSTDVLAITDTDVAAAIRLIRRRFSDPTLSVPQIAAHLNLSRRTLERRFQESFHRSPETEIVRVRIEFAKTLLRDTRLSASTVALRSGFGSSEYFFRVFKRITGMTPNQFRLNNQSVAKVQ